MNRRIIAYKELLMVLACLGASSSHAGSTADWPSITGSVTYDDETRNFTGEVYYDPEGSPRIAADKKPGDFGGILAGAWPEQNTTIDGSMSGNVDPLMFFSGHAVNGTLAPGVFNYNFAAPMIVPLGTVALSVSISFGQTLSDATGVGTFSTPVGATTSIARIGGVDVIGSGGPITNPANGVPDTDSFSFPTVSVVIPYTGQATMAMHVSFTLGAASSSGFSGTLLVTPIAKPLPDAGSSAALLGLALAGIAAVRRRSA